MENVNYNVVANDSMESSDVLSYSLYMRLLYPFFRLSTKINTKKLV